MSRRYHGYVPLWTVCWISVPAEQYFPIISSTVPLFFGRFPSDATLDSFLHRQWKPKPYRQLWKADRSGLESCGHRRRPRPSGWSDDVPFGFEMHRVGVTVECDTTQHQPSAGTGAGTGGCPPHPNPNTLYTHHICGTEAAFQGPASPGLLPLSWDATTETDAQAYHGNGRCAMHCPMI